MNKFFLFTIIFVICGLPIFAKSNIKLGIDKLEEENFESLRNKKIILFANQASRNSDGLETFDLLLNCSKAKLIAVFSPEHGYYSTAVAGKKVANDVIKSIPVVSLYGEKRKPAKEDFRDADLVVIDIQDIGIRSYTYISSVFNIMQACAENRISVLVLDRPNPLGGEIVDGNMPDHKIESFICKIKTPYLHGLTVGEIAKMLNESSALGKNKKCDLKIIKMESWRRSMTWEDTGLDFIPTSPNIPTIDAVRGAAGIGILGELSLLSIGIGTSLPFQYLGSSSVDISPAIESINKDEFGIKLFKTEFAPNFGKNANKNNIGYMLKFDKDKICKPYSFGINLLYELRKRFPDLFGIEIKKNNREMFEKATGSYNILSCVLNGEDYDLLIKEANVGLEKFKNLRKQYFLYD